MHYLLVSILMYANAYVVTGWGNQLPNYNWGEMDCPSLEDRWLSERHILWGIENRAIYTVPDEITVKMSSIPNADFGAFAKTFISRYTWLGEYQGEVVIDVDKISGYAWTVRRNGEAEYYIDSENLDRATWHRWVNCPRHSKEENVVVKYCQGRVYYLLTKDVQPGQELLIYYGDPYAEYLGLDVDNYYNSTTVVHPVECGLETCCKQVA